MGWEFAWRSRKELIAHLCDEPTDYKTLARKVTRERGKSVLWAVHEIGPDDKENPGLRFIVCYLMDRKSGLHGYKEMGETMGPFYYSCPLSFLEMVPEPEGENVKEWRENVLKYHAYMAERARRLAEGRRLVRESLAALDEEDVDDPYLTIDLLNNLCTVLIPQGKLAQAKSMLASLWQLRCSRHDVTGTRLLFVRLAIALLELQPVEVFVGQLKNLLALESLPDHAEAWKAWDIACFVESLRPKIPPDAGDFLTALVSAMNDRTKLAGLDRFPEWRNQPPIPLDTPWPNGQAHRGRDGGSS